MSYLIIYFDEKPVYLCDKIDPEIEEIKHHPDAIYIDELSAPAINSLLREIDKKQFHAGIIFNENLNKLKKDFFKHFKIIKAAGGLVENNKGEVLLIFRREKWDLPKGKLDDDETLEECAVREVQEETGIKNLEIKESINITYHTYKQFGKHILKESHWYKMSAGSDEQLIPQTEEDITEIRWVKTTGLKKYFNNSFPTIITVLKNA